MEIPQEMRGRPKDHRGFPVPWFVTLKDDRGLWDFHNVDADRARQALKHRLCWVSGDKLGRHVGFVIGPMCVINRVSGDPPVRPKLADWSATICPFLTRPRASRQAQKEGEIEGQRGVMVADNPGFCAVWICSEYEMDRSGVLRLGDPSALRWYREGVQVQARDIYDLFEERADVLRAEAEKEGKWAVSAFERQLSDARRLMI